MRARIDRVGVIGGGAMGCGIAVDFAIAGRSVRLFNTRPETSDRARATIERYLGLMVELDLIGADQAADALARIDRTTDLAEAARDRDYLVETVAEDLALKQQVFRDLDRLAPPDAILTSNTTSLSITALAGVCARPERVLTAHYYLPAHLVPLVDVLPADRTDPAAVAVTVALLEECGKAPVVFDRDAPGSVGPRLQTALGAEALRLAEEGVATPEMIDQIIRFGFGRRLAVRGVFDSFDLVGLDLMAAVMRNNGREVPSVVAGKVDRGDLGMKSGRGFYAWPPEEIRAFEERIERHLIRLLQQDRAEGRLRDPARRPG